jgi:ribonuclease R
MHERRADEAARDVTAWLKCVWIRERIGETFAGHVTGVAPFGVFVTLDELHVEGLVHVSELGSEYFRYHETAHELRGERSGRRLRLTDRIEVQVARVDLDARRIDFRPLEGDGLRVAAPGPTGQRRDAPAAAPSTDVPGRGASGPTAGAEKGGTAERTKRAGRSSGSADADRSSAGRAGRNAARKGRTGLRRRH